MTQSELSKNLGIRIRQLRDKRNISQQDLAEMCNVEKTNLARIEAGRTNPTLLTMYKISTALKTSLADLVNFESSVSDDV